MRLLEITLMIPTILVLKAVWDLGKVLPESVVDGKTIVAIAVFSFGLWLLGYMAGSGDL